MAEVPEHLLKRAQEARERAEAQAGGGGSNPPESSGAESSDASAQEDAGGPKIPDHLLDRSKSARDQAAPVEMPAWCRLTSRTLLHADHPDYWIKQR